MLTNIIKIIQLFVQINGKCTFLGLEERRTDCGLLEERPEPEAVRHEERRPHGAKVSNFKTHIFNSKLGKHNNNNNTNNKESTNHGMSNYSNNHNSNHQLEHPMLFMFHEMSTCLLLNLSLFHVNVSY